MDEQPLQYSRHARRRLVTRHITEDEIEAIVRYPGWRVRSSEGTIEHHGYSDDGRLFTIVTDWAQTRVITIIDTLRRRRRNRRR